MDAKSLFLMQHATVHSMTLRGAGGPTLADRTFGRLSDEQMRVRPQPGVNSLAWLLWHIARAEDVIVNVVLAGSTQVLDDGWTKRLRVDRPDIGTGMTADEVAALSDAIEIAALREYRDAVGRRTREFVAAMPDGTWERRVDASDLTRAADAGAFGRVSAGMGAFFANWPGAALLSGIGAIHAAEHIGEALTVRGLGGFGLGV